MNNQLPRFISDLEPWELRFSRKYRVELVHRMNELLLEKGLSQKEVAKKAGWKESFLSRVLAGDQNLTLKTIAKFEEALDDDVFEIPLPDLTKRTHAQGVKVKRRLSPNRSQKISIDMAAIVLGVESTRETFSKEQKNCLWSKKIVATEAMELTDVS